MSEENNTTLHDPSLPFRFEFTYACSHKGIYDKDDDIPLYKQKVCTKCERMECVNCMELFEFAKLKRGYCFNCLLCENCFDDVKKAINPQSPYCLVCEHKYLTELPVVFDQDTLDAGYNSTLHNFQLSGNYVSSALLQLQNNKMQFDEEIAIEEAKVMQYMEKLQQEKRKINTEFLAHNKQLRFLEYEIADTIECTSKAGEVAKNTYAPQQHKDIAKSKLIDATKHLRPPIQIQVPKFILTPSREPEVNILKDDCLENKHLPFNENYVYILEKPSKIYVNKDMFRPRGVFAACTVMVLPINDHSHVSLFQNNNGQLVSIYPSANSGLQQSNWNCLSLTGITFTTAFVTPNALHLNFVDQFGINTSTTIDLSTIRETFGPEKLEGYCFGGITVERQNKWNYTLMMNKTPLVCNIGDHLNHIEENHKSSFGLYRIETIRCSPYMLQLLFHTTLDERHYLCLCTLSIDDKGHYAFKHFPLKFTGNARKSLFVLCYKKVVEISTLPGKFITVHAIKDKELEVLYVVPNAPVPIDNVKDFVRQAYFGYEGKLIIVLNTCTIVY